MLSTIVNAVNVEVEVKANYLKQGQYKEGMTAILESLAAHALQVRLCVCVYSFIHSYIHTYIHTHTHKHTYTYTHIYTHTHTCRT